MTKKVLEANQVTHPDLYHILDLKEVTFKWDNVQGNWTTFADARGINYRKLFESMDKEGMKHPVMVRKINSGYRKWQAGGRRIIYAKMHGYTHIGAYILTTQEQVDEIYAAQYEEIYK
tara:strand:+ start:1973 stop:2326 length:354 start_codon:yes stop_codon:yes gene_type:complete